MAETSWATSIPCTSPLWKYSPQFDGDIGGGWVTQYSGGTETFAKGFVYGYGTATRVTKADGGAFSLDFYGSGITLFGSSSGVSYQVTLDGQQSGGSENSGVLAQFSGLETKSHSVSLQVHPSGSAQFSFERADVTVGTGYTGANVGTTTYDATSTDIKIQDMVSNYESLLANKNRPNYWQGNQVGDSVSLTFQGSAISIYGMCNGENGDFSVNLDGQTQTYNGTASHWELDVLMYHRAGLDPSVSHQITYSNLYREKEFDFISFVTWSVSGGTKFSAAAGGAAGGVATTATAPLTGSGSLLPSQTSGQLSGASSLQGSSASGATNTVALLGPNYSGSSGASLTSGDPSSSQTGQVGSGSGAGSGGTNPNGGESLGSVSDSSKTVIILGAILGAVGLFALLALVFFLGRRRERRRLGKLPPLEPYRQPDPELDPAPLPHVAEVSLKPALFGERGFASAPDNQPNTSSSTSSFILTPIPRHPLQPSQLTASRNSLSPLTSPLEEENSPETRILSFASTLPPTFTFSALSTSPPPEYAPRSS